MLFTWLIAAIIGGGLIVAFYDEIKAWAEGLFNKSFKLYQESMGVYPSHSWWYQTNDTLHSEWLNDGRVTKERS